MNKRIVSLIVSTRKLCFATLIIIGLYLTPHQVVAVESSELIRASIIEKIARFITWPPFNAEQFNLCVSSKAPLLPAIQSYYANETLANKSVKIMIFDNTDKLNQCQIIYVNSEIKDQLGPILTAVQQSSVLIIAENKNAVEAGAHIDFYIDDKKINIELNRTALEQSGLTASYHLLKVVRLVD
ncbi:YfiR family protein [Methylomonas lenta]|uniref:YfiR family protein n=1 Tax=Methylomonas lenta TaxID=980561 RepID=UPI0018DB7DE3|nr:YfiR family protein [Methylomonas lenta]